MMRDEQPAGGGSTTLRASVGVGVIGAGMMGTMRVLRGERGMVG